MKTLFKITLPLLFLSAVCSSQASAQERINTNFVHTVFFWFKNPDDADGKKLFEKSLKKFIESSEYIKSAHVGTPANTKKRDVVDHSFTYCLSVIFANQEDHDKYQVEEVHKQFIKESSHLWKKVEVYDSESVW